MLRQEEDGHRRRPLQGSLEEQDPLPRARESPGLIHDSNGEPKPTDMMLFS